MGLRKIRPLVPGALADLDWCRVCGFGDPQGDDLLDSGAAWARRAQERWGLVGVGLESGARTGWALICPPDALPDSHPLCGMVDDLNVAVLVALSVEGGVRCGGLGRHLVQSLAARLVGRAPAIEAAGARGQSSCQIPAAAWLLETGFETCPRFDWLPGGAQHLSLDLARTLPWQPKLTGVVERLLGWTPAVANPAQDARTMAGGGPVSPLRHQCSGPVARAR